MTDGQHPAILKAEGICYSYHKGSPPAVDNASLCLFYGELHLLIGENGAGKSTLARLLSRQIECRTGSILGRGLEGTRVSYLPQHLPVLPNCSFAEYLWLFYSADNPDLPWFTRSQQRREIIASVLQLLEVDDFNPSILKEQVNVVSSNLIHLYTAFIQLSRRDTQLYILDEPTAVLSETEAGRLYRFIQKVLENSHSASVLMITHRITEAAKYAQRHTVMRGGKTVHNGTGLDPQAMEAVYKSMFGKYENSVPSKSPNNTPGTEITTGNVLLQLHNVTADFKDLCALEISKLNVHSGEIHAVSGIRDEGLEQLERLLSGRREQFTGHIELLGKTVTRMVMEDLRGAGLRFVPSERGRFGSALQLKNFENLGALLRLKFSGSQKAFKDSVLSSLGTTELRPDIPSAELSGGMLQRLIVRREMDTVFEENNTGTTSPRLCILANPGWGLDALHRDSLYKKILLLKENGWAILLLTTELQEAMHLGDTISFIHGGQLHTTSTSEHGNTVQMQKYFLGQFPRNPGDAN